MTSHTSSIQLLTPELWKEYELLDSGGFEKLERFGNYILSRPEPQAVWDKSLTTEEWEKRAHAFFRKEKNNPEKGQWELKRGMIERWWMNYQTHDLKLTFKMALSSFKHVGIFPEQAVNWDYIAAKVKALKNTNSQVSVLNLFAYTGGASLAARQAGADVTHVDSVKQVISWSRENMEGSSLDNIRWIVEDAMKFVKREVRRGNQYQGIILDPPAYGRGADGEKWILEEQINEMLKLCQQLVDPEKHFLILNVYSLGFSSLIVDNLIRSNFGIVQNPEMGELYLNDSFDKKLPLGVFYRFATI
ncbi:class I SAM-dependent methyltransferase [Cytophagaceae bacterium DM2B3-1]|uniref:Class I SAM-dependent methyltransferase n=1 Tax=Xanthocytophaga flava TaxID=3048013 RepID=A0ABT7CJM0_9BACT|nr:class I SAM-dependent methyltransferase [Xanthocytophaga flavus]MDJ1493931.1 class I SAM-dependent methyltransferase [Xanthocytophaga flavus]